jgi:hypothetical protein
VGSVAFNKHSPRDSPRSPHCNFKPR